MRRRMNRCRRADRCRAGASQRALEEEAEMMHMQKPLSISDVDFWHEVGVNLPPERQNEYSRCPLSFVSSYRSAGLPAPLHLHA